VWLVISMLMLGEHMPLNDPAAEDPCQSNLPLVASFVHLAFYLAGVVASEGVLPAASLAAGLQIQTHSGSLVWQTVQPCVCNC
jgi:hypothetical protein